MQRSSTIQVSLDIETPTVIVSSQGKDTFEVAYDPKSGKSLVTAYHYPIQVQPTGGSQAPFTLESGQEVEISDGQVRQATPSGQMPGEETARNPGFVPEGWQGGCYADPVTAAEGRRLGVEVIRGLEINTDAREGEFHVLGYLVDEESEPFRRAIRRGREERWVRARAIVSRLRDAGFRITDDDVLAAAKGAPVCRPHIAVALAGAGYAPTDHEAFTRYLRGRSPFFVPHTGLTVREAIAAIRSAGGVPVLSHPTDLPEEAVLALRPLGLMGIEVNHPDHSPEAAVRWLDVARRHGLVATGGSDYHSADSVEPDRALGSCLAPPGRWPLMIIISKVQIGPIHLGICKC